jgi:toxin CptA
VQIIKLRPSWLLTAILAVAHGVAMVLIAIVSMPIWLKVIISAALVLSCFHSVRRAALLLTPCSAVAIEVTSAHLLNVQTRDSDWIECEVLGTTYVASFLTILNLRQIEQRTIRHIIILPDGIETDDFRKLRVWLRWQRGPQSGR